MDNNITNEELAAIEECQTYDDWSKVCRDIKDARGGIEYPPDWWEKVKESGLMDKVFARWGSTSEIKVTIMK